MFYIHTPKSGRLVATLLKKTIVLYVLADPWNKILSTSFYLQPEVGVR